MYVHPTLLCKSEEQVVFNSKNNVFINWDEGIRRHIVGNVMIRFGHSMKRLLQEEASGVRAVTESIPSAMLTDRRNGTLCLFSFKVTRWEFDYGVCGWINESGFSSIKPDYINFKKGYPPPFSFTVNSRTKNKGKQQHNMFSCGRIFFLDALEREGYFGDICKNVDVRENKQEKLSVAHLLHISNDVNPVNLACQVLRYQADIGGCNGILRHCSHAEFQGFQHTCPSGIPNGLGLNKDCYTVEDCDEYASLMGLGCLGQW